MKQTYLKSKLHYEPKTGIFTWLDTKSSNANNGDIAGCKSKNDGYIEIRVGYKLYKAHRLAWLYMTGSMPSEQIDHINHKRDDNRFKNLREVTHAENKRNNSMQSNNKSGVTGVCWNKRTKKWVAQMTINGKSVGGKHYENLDDAIKVRLELEKEHGFHINHGKDL